MERRRFSIDTNLLIYSVNSNDPEKHQIAKWLIDKLMFLDCAIALQALSEFTAVILKKKIMPLSEALLQIKDWQTVFPVISADPSALTKAIQGVTTYRLSFWDALLWATTKQAGINVLFSEDFQHNQVIEGVRFCNPFLAKSPLEALLSE